MVGKAVDLEALRKATGAMVVLVVVVDMVQVAVAVAAELVVVMAVVVAAVATVICLVEEVAMEEEVVIRVIHPKRRNQTKAQNQLPVGSARQIPSPRNRLHQHHKCLPKRESFHFYHYPQPESADE